MLAELRVQNLALIDSLQVELEPGFNVFTGETGAGKSILMNAIALVVGDKSSFDLIKAGMGTATVDALFEVSTVDRAFQVAADLGIDLMQEREFCEFEGSRHGGNGAASLVISREVGSRSRCRVNGRPVTVQMLKDLGQTLIDVHGQHDHQSLLRPLQHLEFLDRFGGQKVWELRDEVAKAYREVHRLRAQIRELATDERNRAQRVDLLQYQLKEIDSAQLESGEENHLSEEHHRLSNAERLRTGAFAVLASLSDEDGDKNLLTVLGQCLTKAKETGEIDPAFRETASNIETAFYHLEEAVACVRGYLDSLDADPSRLDEVESRLHLVHQLKKKYGDTVESVLRYRDAIAEELERLTHADERIAELQQQKDEAEQRLAEIAGRLSLERQAAGKAFRKAIVTHLKDVAMANARFSAEVQQVEEPEGLPLNGRRLHVGERGIDQVEFLISPNTGQPLKPLARIASGGELSRVMLAIKSAVRQRHDVPTLVFDEIDAGIGGATAEAVGRKLKELSRFAQILCVTHLPQIACLAEAHFRVLKTATDSDTSVTIERLGEADQVEELARMLGGHKPTATARQHAREMWERGRS